MKQAPKSAPRRVNKKGKAAQQKSSKNAISNLVNRQIIEQITANLLNNDDDSDSEIEAMDATPTTSAKTTPPIQEEKNYKSQVVILEGVDDALKKNPARLSKALRETKPTLEVKKIRITASNAVLIEPKHPRDCCTLLKKGAFTSNSPLGANVTARLPRENTVTHQVIIKGLDTDITDDELKEMLDRQEMPHNGVKRIHSRQRGCATEMVRLFLKSEEKKKHLLRQGIFLDQMHFDCVAAKEDLEKKLTFQCFKCQAWGDHKTWECKGDTKCVICGGPHKKAECTKTKAEAKCCNCGGEHAAWSTICPSYKSSVEQKKSKTFATATSENIVTSAKLEEQVQTVVSKALSSIKKQIAIIVAEVVAKSFLDHIYYERECKKTNGQTYLSANARTSAIAKTATNSVNKCSFFPQDETSITSEEVSQEVNERLKSSFTQNLNGSPSTGSQ